MSKSEELPTIKQLFDLSGKTAIVTGGAMGIGYAIAARLAEAGAAVMIADIDLEKAEETAKEFQAKGWNVKAIKADVSNLDDVKSVVNTTVDTFGGLDILVNNAGIYPMSPVLEITPELWEKVMKVNINGVFNFSQQAALKMKDKGGTIINLASVDGFHPTGSLVHYDTSKGGVVMMTKALAAELSPMGIRVNAIAPGGINTEGAASAGADSMKSMTDSGMTPEDITAAFTARIPLRRMGVPDDIGKVSLFLATELSSYMTGEVVVVDGGYLQG